MAILEEKFSIRTDSNGLAVIDITGRCTEDEKADIEAGATRRYEMIQVPNTAGAVLKPLDGTKGSLIDVEPPNMTPASFRCVKVDGRANSYAPTQVGGTHDGRRILLYVKTYQEVGGVS